MQIRCGAKEVTAFCCPAAQGTEKKGMVVLSPLQQAKV
jgi:hypothetical protein